MKYSIVFFNLLLLLFLASTALTANEAYFKFEINNKAEIEKLTRIISIDNVKGNLIYAYANDREWAEFNKLGYNVTILPHPGTLIKPEMAEDKADMKDWDVYPTYTAYIDMMNQFAIDYPSLCRIVNFGTTNNGRDLLMAVISDNVSIEEDEPEVMYTSSMHGDELTGYPSMLHLIDSLLTAYGTDSLITRLVDSCEIWINPLANPDGTYTGSNNSIVNPTRTNANGVNLNRNYPDPEDGPHPDGNAWQTETIAFMDLAEAQDFVISGNFHGGAEVFNYPWDTWVRRHADDQWWQDVGHIFVDSAQVYMGSGYFTGFDDGISNGYDWYSIAGGRQDYMNYFHNCREVTLEISDVKFISASQLPAHWNALKRSFLDYFENALYGIRGIVTDNVSGLPVKAKVEIPGHDIDSTHIYTDSDVGNYHRMLEAGVYDLEFSAPGYFSQTIENITVTDWDAVRVDVALVPLPNEPVFELEEYSASQVQPGDHVSMYITINNLGGGNAYNTVGGIQSTDPWVSITQASANYPTIAALGGSGTSLTAYEFDIDPACTLFHQIEFQLALEADGPNYDTLTINFLVGDRVVFFTDNFAFDQGWTGLGGSGEWTIGEAVGGSGSDGSGGPDPSVDHSSTGDNYVLGNDLTGGSGGDYNSGLSSTYWVTSPYIDCTNMTGVEIRFWRWLGIESNSYDHAYFEVYNGTSWITLYENSGTLNESAWSEQYYDLSTYADNNPDFQIRYGIGTTDGSAEYCGWNIDDVELKGYGTVSSGTPDLAYTPSDINDSLFLDIIKIDTVIAKNNGDGLLRLRFTSQDSWITLNEDQQNIYPGDSLIAPVTINTAGLTPGNFIGEIDFTSNDPDTPSGTVLVNLHIFSPDINVTESSIAETLIQETQLTHELTIENNGPGELSYNITRQMFNGKSASPAQKPEPLGYQVFDKEKGGIEEPYFAGRNKSNGGPDSWGHNWIDSDEPSGPTFSWVDISGSGTSVSLDDDDTTTAIPIGFSFPYYENYYDQLYIGSNGLLTFGTPSSSRTNVTIPTSSAPNDMIVIWWDDLDPSSGGSIYYYYDAANQRFIVSFVSVPNYKSGGGTGSLSFQAILYENGKILMQYLTMEPGSDGAGLAGSTVGIENMAGDDGLEMTFNAAYMHDNLAIQIVAASWLTINPGTGIIAPYSSTVIDVDFDAAGLSPNDYDGQLTVNSNDPDSPTIVLPVTMTVTQGQVAPSPPALSEPANEATDVGLQVDLVWNSAFSADQYQVQLDSSLSFTSLILDSTLADTSATMEGLDEATIYYWRVRAHNEYGWSDYSATWNFNSTAGTWICGDVENDGLINIIDVTYLIIFIYQFGPPPEPLERADVNSSGTVNILDISYIIDYLYNDGPPPVCP